MRGPTVDAANTSLNSSICNQINNTNNKKVAEYRLVRTDSQQKRLDEFLNPLDMDVSSSQIVTGENIPVSSSHSIANENFPVSASEIVTGENTAVSASQTTDDEDFAVSSSQTTVIAEDDDQLMASLDVDKIVAEATSQGFAGSSMASTSASRNLNVFLKSSSFTSNFKFQIKPQVTMKFLAQAENAQRQPRLMINQRWSHFLQQKIMKIRLK